MLFTEIYHLPRMDVEIGECVHSVLLSCRMGTPLAGGNKISGSWPNCLAGVNRNVAGL